MLLYKLRWDYYSPPSPSTDENSNDGAVALTSARKVEQKTAFAAKIDDIDYLYVRRFFPLSESQLDSICVKGRMFHNHIPGDEHLTHKDLIVKHLIEGGFVSLGQDGGAASDQQEFIVPKTWAVTDETERKKFCSDMESPTKKNDQAYMKKEARGIHNAHGVQYYDNSYLLEQEYCSSGNSPEDKTDDNAEEEEESSREDTEEGNEQRRQIRSSSDDKVTIVQEYIQPALVQGRKFDIRYHAYILSASPLVVADILHNSVVRVSAVQYNDASADDKYKHITNNHLNQQAVNRGAADGTLDSGLMWSLERLATTLASQPEYEDVFEGVTAAEWMESSLIPQIHSAIKAVLKAAAPHMTMNCIGSFGYLGFDIMLSHPDLKVVFIESSVSSNVWWAHGKQFMYSADDKAGQAVATALLPLGTRLFEFHEQRRRLIKDKDVSGWKREFARWDIQAKLDMPQVSLIIDER